MARAFLMARLAARGLARLMALALTLTIEIEAEIEGLESRREAVRQDIVRYEGTRGELVRAKDVKPFAIRVQRPDAGA